MALKRWYETMNSNDCLEDNVTFNDMTNYIKHSSCTDLTIYSTCSDTGQAFRFTQAGTMSTSYGGTNAGDNRQWRANDADTYPYIEGLGGSHLKFYTGNDIYFYDNAVEEFRFYDNSVDIKGDRAIYVNDDETYIGHGAGDNIGAGTNNTLVGHDAGQANNFSNAVLLGYEAGKNNTQDSIIAIGYQALSNNSGTENIAVGYLAISAACTGAQNTVLGHSAGKLNTSGGNNVGVGRAALYSNTEGNGNTAVGDAAVYTNSTGINNTGIGRYALLTNSTGDRNVAIGQGAQQLNIVSGIVAIGYSAGKNNAASNRLYINNSESAYPLIYGEFDNDIVAFGDNSAAWNIKFVSSAMHMLETTTPGAIADYGAIYCKANNKLYFQDGAGVEHEVAFV